MQVSSEHVYLFRHAAAILPDEVIIIILAEMCRLGIDDYKIRQCAAKSVIKVNMIIAKTASLYQTRKLLADFRTSDLTTSLYHLAEDMWRSVMLEQGFDCDEDDNSTRLQTQFDTNWQYDTMHIDADHDYCYATIVQGRITVFLRHVSYTELLQLVDEDIWITRIR